VGQQAVKPRLHEFMSKKGIMWYLTNEAGMTSWFREQPDREFYMSGGRCTWSPGRDTNNRFFVGREVGVPAPAPLPAGEQEKNDISKPSDDLMVVVDKIQHLLDTLRNGLQKK
jgi:hypothetical protein